MILLKEVSNANFCDGPDVIFSLSLSLVTPHVSDVMGVIVLTSFVCLSVTGEAKEFIVRFF